VLCVGCGAGTVAPNAVNGSVSGYSLQARDGVSEVVQNTPSVSFAMVLVTSVANACPLFSSGHMLRNDQTLLLRLARREQDQSGTRTLPPSVVGEYPIVSEVAIPVSGKFAILDFVVIDAACTAIQTLESTSGKVTLTRIDAKGYTGTFDVTFTSGDHVTGSFDTIDCPALTPGSTPHTCG
jgi:hypothetical protein